MKRLLLALVVCLLPVPASAAVSASFKGQGANGASAGPTHAFTSSVAAGDVLVLLVQNRTDETTTITSVTDTLTNSWTQMSFSPFSHPGGTTQRLYGWICQSSAAGTPTVTINFSGSISSTYAAVAFTGAATSGQPDAADGTPASGSSTAYASNTLTPNTTGMILSMGVTTGSVTASATAGDYTRLTTSPGRVHLWTSPSVASVGEAISDTLGTSTGWIAGMINIKEASAAGCGTTLALTGAGCR